MHELSVAAALFEWAREQSRVYAPRSIRSIEIELDALSCLNQDALRFGFEAISAQSDLASTALEFVDVASTYVCGVCGQSAAGTTAPLSCASCGAPLPRLSRDSSLTVRSIELE